MEDIQKQFLSIGELARLVGVSVRTLQYYDRENLLNSKVTDGGRRMYARNDVLRLEQILFLKSLGFSLEEINEKILDLKTSADFERIFTEQRKILTGQIEHLNRIVEMLDSVIAETKTGQEINMNRLITIMESMKQGNPYTFVVRYFDDDQLKSIASQMFNSPEHFDQAKMIFKQLDDLYRKGTDPKSKEGQQLAKDWWNMVMNFTNCDINLLKPLLQAGKDINNWPEEANNAKEYIENFLVKALNIYLSNNGIQITELESGINKI
jgi:DNA-binding transcriptional MerR regulator